MPTLEAPPVEPPPVEAPPVEAPPIVALCNLESVILLCVLPFSNICGFLWCYTALPLAFVDNGWPLWQLSVMLTAIYAPRVLVTIISKRVGDWVCAPLAGVAALLNMLMLIWPGSIAVVWCATSATCASQCPTAYRSLLYARFSASGKWQTQRASRIFTLADTLGYACAPFVGGLLYDGGGLRLCAVFACATSVMGTVLPFSLTVFRRSLVRAGRSAVASAAGIGERAAIEIAPVAQADSPVRGSGGRVAPTQKSSRNALDPRSSATRESFEAVGAAKAMPTGDACSRGGPCVPVGVVMIAVFANICAYGVEWCLYALYFRLEYGWSGAWCGFAQMVGDLLGASVLGLSTTAYAARASRLCTLPGCVRALVRAPLNISVFLYSHSVLLVMLAQPAFAVALLGQVLLGTVYVFCEQSLQELLLLYSHDDHTVYRRLVFGHYLAFVRALTPPPQPCALTPFLSHALSKSIKVRPAEPIVTPSLLTLRPRLQSASTRPRLLPPLIARACADRWMRTLLTDRVRAVRRELLCARLLRHGSSRGPGGQRLWPLLCSSSLLSFHRRVWQPQCCGSSTAQHGRSCDMIRPSVFQSDRPNPRAVWRGERAL